MEINIPVSATVSAIRNALKGKKMYLTLACGAAYIAANHYGLIPPDYVPKDAAGHPQLDPNNWIFDEYKLLIGATGRAAVAKVEGALAALVSAATSFSATPPPPATS